MKYLVFMPAWFYHERHDLKVSNMTVERGLISDALAVYKHIFPTCIFECSNKDCLWVTGCPYIRWWPSLGAPAGVHH